MATSDSQLLSIVASTTTKDKRQTSTVCESSCNNLFLTSKGISRFLVTYLQHHIREIENQFEGAGVKISIGRDGLDFMINGDNYQDLYRAYELLKELVSLAVTQEFEIKQPGMRMFFGEGGDGEQLVKSIEKDYSCIIEMEFEKQVPRGEGKEEKDGKSGMRRETVVKGKQDETTNTPARENQGSGGGDSAVITPEGVRISWKVGNIATEKVDVLVNSVKPDLDLSCGAISSALSRAAGPELQRACKENTNCLNLSEVLVTRPGNLPCKHVIHVVCYSWNIGSSDKCEEDLRTVVGNCLRKAEELCAGSIAFPAIGSGNLNFPLEIVAQIFMEEALEFNSLPDKDKSITDIRFIVYDQDDQTRDAFSREMKAAKTYFERTVKCPFKTACDKNSTYLPRKEISKVEVGEVTVKVVKGDVGEPSDCVVCVNDVNMNFVGNTSVVLDKAGGPEVKHACARLAPQSSGTVVMPSPGHLPAKYAIHIVPEAELSKYQGCLVEALKRADSKELTSVLVPVLESNPSAINVTFGAALQFLQKQPLAVREITVCQVSEKTLHSANFGFATESTCPCAKFLICGAEETKVREVKEVFTEILKKSLCETSIVEKLENDIVQRFDSCDKNLLFSKAKELDVKLEIKGIQVIISGRRTSVDAMYSEVLKLFTKGLEKEVREHAQLVWKNVKWQYTRHGEVNAFGELANAVIEKAFSDFQDSVMCCMAEGEKVIIDFKTMTYTCSEGCGCIERTPALNIPGLSNSLPPHWEPQPCDPVTQKQLTLYYVMLDQRSDEYKQVCKQFYDTEGAGDIVKIERVQNPHLYRAYMVRKEKMAADNGSTENELQLFHGTHPKNVKAISTQGFNRSYCGVNGVVYGKGVYFAKKAGYSLQYAPSSPSKGKKFKRRYMFIAHVLVGMYTAGQSRMVAPPPKHCSRPEILFDSVVDNIRNPTIYVVFHDTQCYPAYLISFY